MSAKYVTMAIGSGYEACKGQAETRRRVGRANDIAGDPRGMRALALSFHSVNVVGGLLRGGHDMWGHLHVNVSLFCGEWYLGGWGLTCG